MANAKSGTARKLAIILGITLVIAGGAVAYYFYHKREAVISVQSDKVTRRNLTELVVANGRIQPVVQVKISTEVSGEIIELPVKEGQLVKKGDLLLRIKPDAYQANRRSAEASYQSALASRNLAAASLRKADVECKRNKDLLESGLISDSAYLEFKTAFEVAEANSESFAHQVDVAKAALARAEEELSKTTICSPITGTVSKLNSELGERVVGTAMMTGTEVMVVSDLNEMEARVDIGEIDVVLIAPRQNARLEVDAFRDRKFNGTVTEIANSSKGLGQPGGGGGGGGNGQQQEATKFEVKIRIREKEVFRPGMSVTAEIETRSRTNVLSVPTQSVTTRLPREQKDAAKSAGKSASQNDPPAVDPNKPKADKAPRAVEVIFAVNGDRAKMLPVKRGISDENFTEIIEGLQEGQEVISGGYKAISRELEDAKRIRKGEPEKEKK